MWFEYHGILARTQGCSVVRKRDLLIEVGQIKGSFVDNGLVCTFICVLQGFQIEVFHVFFRAIVVSEGEIAVKVALTIDLWHIVELGMNVVGHSLLHGTIHT